MPLHAGRITGDNFPGALGCTGLGTATPSEAQLANPPPGCPYEFRRFPQGIARIFSRPALHKPMFVDAPAFGNFLLFARALGHPESVVLDDGLPMPEHWMQVIAATAERLTVPIDWRSGDLLMLDNTRFMHGRTEIIEPAERVILINTELTSDLEKASRRLERWTDVPPASVDYGAARDALKSRVSTLLDQMALDQKRH